MTQSEIICSELGEKFFGKDYVYENLKYFNENNQKIELCDGLFEYADMYLAIQIKERSLQNGGKSHKDWLSSVVYGKAVQQMIITVSTLTNRSININDLYHQNLKTNPNNIVYPMIIFDNIDVNDYKKIIRVGGLSIHIFSMEDYKNMMQVLIHPLDIFSYLEQRNDWLNDGGALPKFAFGESDDFSLVSSIDSEKDFARFYDLYTYGQNSSTKMAALQLLSIITKFRDKQARKNKDYKQILRILQLIDVGCAPAFMDRFNFAWKNSFEDRFDLTKAIMQIYQEKRVQIVFVSLGFTPLEKQEYYRIICDAKQLQHECEAVLIISFVGNNKDCNCFINWVYSEGKCEKSDDMFEKYKAVGMYDGTITRETFNMICALACP